MLLLFETSAGYGLFKIKDESKLKDVEDLSKVMADEAKAQKQLKLLSFAKFTDTAQAVEAASAVTESKMDKGLKSFLKKEIVSKSLKDSLAVADTKLGNLIQEKLKIPCVYDASVAELLRGVRAHFSQLIADMGATDSDLKVMNLGLAHSLSRYKLKFSPDKVDVMIVQAISLLDDLDKELNTYAMRVREWFGWHFPEMSKLISENLAYAKCVKQMGKSFYFWIDRSMVIRIPVHRSCQKQSYNKYHSI